MNAIEYLTPRQVAARWHLAVSTLANYRSARIGPPYIKTPPGRILYVDHEVEAWIRSNCGVAA